MIDPKINQAAAKNTAAALVSLFPKVTLIDAKFTRYGFSVDATIPKGFSKEAFPHIEERIRSLPKPKMLQMMGSNAADYLKNSCQIVRAEKAKQQGKNIVSIIQIGDFVDLCLHPITETFDGYRLLEYYQDGDRIHLIGAAHATQDASKAYAKNYFQYKQNDHMLHFEIIDGKIGFSPSFEAMRFALICKWRDFMHANGGQIYIGQKRPEGFCGQMVDVNGAEESSSLLDYAHAKAFELHNTPPGIVKSFLDGFGLPITEKNQKYYTTDAFGTFWCIGSEKLCYASLERQLALMIENNCQELLC